VPAVLIDSADTMNPEDNAGVRMRLRVASACTLILACSWITVAQTKTEAATTTICRIIAKPGAYAGKMVSVEAVYAGSFEGAYLVDPICRKDVWFTTPEQNASIAAITVRGPYPRTPKSNFELIKDEEYDKFEKFAYATVENLQPQYEVTAIFTGRIDRCNNFKVDKNGFGNGFGQMGQSEFQLVLLSVFDVKVKQAEGILTPEKSVLPDQIPTKR